MSSNSRISNNALISSDSLNSKNSLISSNLLINSNMLITQFQTPWPFNTLTTMPKDVCTITLYNMPNNTKNNANDTFTEQGAAEAQQPTNFSFKVEHSRHPNSLAKRGEDTH